MPRRYTMMLFLMLALFLCYVDRVLISLAAVDMQKELGWSDTGKGLIFSAFFIGYFAMQIGSGILSRIHGGRNVLLIAVLLWSLFTMLTPPAAYASFTILIFTRFMLGFGEGAAYPAAYNLVYGWMKEGEISRAISLTTAASTVGTVFAFLVVGKLIGLYGWQWVFYFFGSLGAVWAVFWIRYIPARPGTGVPENKEHGNGKNAALNIPWKIIFTSAPSLALFYIAACFWGVIFPLASWLPSYYVDTFQVSLTQAGIYSVLPWLVVSVCTILAGILADRLLERGTAKIRVRKGFIGVSTGGAAISLLFLMNSPSLVLSIFLVSLLFAFIGLIVPGFAPNAADILPSHGEVLYGFLAATGSLSGAIVTALIGILLDRTGNYESVFLLMAALSFSGLLVFQLFGKAEPMIKTGVRNV